MTLSITFNKRESQMLKSYAAQADQGRGDIDSAVKKLIHEKLIDTFRLLPHELQVKRSLRKPHYKTLQKYTPRVKRILRDVVMRNNKRFGRATLSNLEMQVLSLRAGIRYEDHEPADSPRPLREVGEILEMSRTQVMRIEKEIFERSGLGVSGK